MKRAMVFRRAFFLWEKPGRRGGKSGRFRHCVQAGACPALPRSGSRQRCGVQAGGSRLFLGGGGAAQKSVMPDGHFLMWGRALRGRSIGRKSGSEAWTRRATAGGNSPELRRSRKERRARSGEKFPVRGQRQARSRAGMRRRGVYFPASVMVSAGGTCILGGPKEGRRTVTRGPAQLKRRGEPPSTSDAGWTFRTPEPLTVDASVPPPDPLTRAVGARASVPTS